jgi:hypothetical protein
LEEHLHQLVCAGRLDLPTAQRDIARDWIAAYKKYFHTDRPVAERPDMGVFATAVPKAQRRYFFSPNA